MVSQKKYISIWTKPYFKKILEMDGTLCHIFEIIIILNNWITIHYIYYNWPILVDI